MRTKLSRVTLICIDCSRHGEALVAIQKSMEQCDFASVKFLTDRDMDLGYKIQVIKILPIKSKEEYSRFVVKELYKYINTEFCLIIQHDGYVLNGKSWSDDFYNYDYIGAPWLYTDGRNVGNGGFSLRSFRLQTIIATDKNIEITSPEDEIIGRLYRHYLENGYGFNFADEETADKFAYELRPPIYDTFGFHGRFHKPYQKTVVVKRQASMGDVILVEPVLHYFHKKGYRVVLDTLDQFYMLFVNHYFPVHHPKAINKIFLDTAEFYNLDMAYESFPKQNRLLTYYQYCGIKDGEIRNPKLHVGFEINEATKLSPKYCIIHLEGIKQSGRNVFGVDWESVVANIQSRGYAVFQVGKRNVPLIKNTIYLNTMNENFLCWAVGSADFFIGIDSGVSHVASAFNVPSILFFGNTNPEIVHAEISNKILLTNHVSGSPICNKPYCWHEQIGVESEPCYINETMPPCAVYSTAKVLEAIDSVQKLIK
jgi:ADP-heptose:LPS heptosyltransferase